MRRAPLLRLLPFLLAVLALLAPVRTHAQMSETERKSTARAAYTEGVALKDDKRWAEALAKFEAAQKLFDAPTHLLNIAECQVQIGKLVEAQETYEVLIRKPLGANPPEAFVAAQKTGEQELPALRARIPTLRVSVRPDPAQLPNLQVVSNGAQMPVELLGIARPVNPGTYRLTATANGWATPGPTEVDLRDKDQRAVELTLVRSGPPVVAPIPPPYTGPPQQNTGPQPTPQPAPAPSVLEAPKPPPKALGSSDTGLLFGLRAGLFVPGGKVVSGSGGLLGIVQTSPDTTFDDVARSGGGFGGDAMFRLGRSLLLGFGVDWASLGSPDGKSGDYTASTLYYGGILGLLTNPDKTAFYGDVTLGRRSLSLKDPAPADGFREKSFAGIELGIGMGVMIPAGPMRILPKLALNLGEFGTVERCNPSIPCASAANTSGLHSMIFLGLGAYYHLDLGKKK